MGQTQPATPTPAVFGAALVEAGMLVPMGASGLYGRDTRLESLIASVDRLVLRAGAADGAERFAFPPVIPRHLLERSGYLRSFPHLIGTVHGFTGGESEHVALLERLDEGAEWCESLQPTEVVLTPAACYPVYPAIAGRLPAEGRLFDVCSPVFRHEPSDDPTRLQSFRMREQVRAGTAQQCLEHRDRWVERALALLHALELPGRVLAANDPFFGRTGRMMASSQRERELKLELVIPVAGRPTAGASSNCHEEHFGTTFGIRLADGAPAQTACVGFGLERLALALLWHHGLHTERWPRSVRELLTA